MKHKQAQFPCQLRALHRELENFLMAVFLFKLHSAPEIELSTVSLHDNDLLEKAAPSPPRQTWLTFLKKELEFLGVSEPPLISTRVKTGSKKVYLLAPT